MNPLLLAPLFKLGEKVFDRVLPDAEAKAKAKADFAMQLTAMDQADEDSFRDFVVAYEGAGDKVHPAIQILRGSVRPILTYCLAGIFAWGFIHPNDIDQGTMQMLFQLNLLSLGFWFGERALKNLGLNLAGRHDKNKSDTL